MKKITYFILLFLAFNFGFGQTTLAEGDIVITGVNADDPDQFSFVLLTDVLSGTQINFTDEGWFKTGGFRTYDSIADKLTSEGVVTWEAITDLACGTEIIIERLPASSFSSTIGLATLTDSGFLLAGEDGDQLFAFQGSISTPTFLYAVHFGNKNGWTDAAGNNDSAIPAGLTDGINAMNLGSWDNGVYNCSVTINQSLILAAAVNPTNWLTHNRNRQALGVCTFICNTPTSCLSTVTWNGTWSGVPDLTTEVIIDAPYNTSSGNFRACSLIVNASLDVINNTYVEVENDVIINGTITIQTTGNFVQNDSRGTFTVNSATGTASVIKQTSIKNAWYYYTYWSSPVFGQTIEGAFPDIDGDRRFSFNAANFNDNNDDDIDDNNNDWQYALGNDIMTPGVGYIATASRFHIPGATDNATFKGEFNTSNVDVNITFDPTNVGIKWNLIGNPYPSAIDLIAFQAANSTVIDGTAYFWSQESPPSASNPGNQQLNFSASDYAVFTVGTGGASASIDTESPNGYVASGQSFFIPAISIGTATFTNAMRMADKTSNNQFFKSSNIKKSNNPKPLENRLWINLTSDNGVFNQILVGYVDNATDHNDGLFYDAPKLITPDYASVLYSTIDDENKKFVIQGKSVNSININEIIKLGFKTVIDVPTLYTLSLADLQGDFLKENAIYLKDNLLNKTHNLSIGDYTFTSEVGEFNNRFEIVFKADALSVNYMVSNEKLLSIVELDNDQVQFNVSNNLKIKSVSVFDLLGRQLYHFKGQNSTERYRLSNLNNTVYIAKVTLSDGTVITKKAVKK